MLLLSGLLGAVNSYYHPTSTGSYSDRIIEFINKLIYGFMTRLSRERYDLASPVLWVPTTKAEDRLTDAQVEELCRIVLPANLNLATSRKYVDIERINLSILAHMRPDIIVPPLIRKLDLSLETLTEPFKFTAAVKCIVAGNLPAEIYLLKFCGNKSLTKEKRKMRKRWSLK